MQFLDLITYPAASVGSVSVHQETPKRALSKLTKKAIVTNVKK